MNYIGSKQSLLPFLGSIYQEVAAGDEKTFCDIFAGTAAVGRYFKRLGLRVIANDIQYYAFVLNKAYIEINRPPAFATLRNQYRNLWRPYANQSDSPAEQALAFINDLPGVRGFIARHYGPEGSRLYYTKENAERADAVRLALKRWLKQGVINEREYFYALCSLLEAIDQAANTASVYGAFLKKFKSTAKKSFRLKPLELVNHVRGCRVYNEDANDLIKEVKCDVLYLDPPYNHRQYGANYHVLETIAAYDRPRLRGMTGLRAYERSRYCQRRAAKDALAQLVMAARARHILLSYNDEGLLTLDEVRDILSLRGRPQTFETPYNRFKADNNRAYKRDSTIEYVHYVRVTKR